MVKTLIVGKDNMNINKVKINIIRLGLKKFSTSILYEYKRGKFSDLSFIIGGLPSLNGAKDYENNKKWFLWFELDPNKPHLNEFIEFYDQVIEKIAEEIIGNSHFLSYLGIDRVDSFNGKYITMSDLIQTIKGRFYHILKQSYMKDYEDKYSLKLKLKKNFKTNKIMTLVKQKKYNSIIELNDGNVVSYLTNEHLYTVYFHFNHFTVYNGKICLYNSMNRILLTSPENARVDFDHGFDYPKKKEAEEGSAQESETESEIGLDLLKLSSRSQFDEVE